MNTSKLTDMMFRKVDNVVYDLMSGAIAIKKDSGLVSYNTKTEELETNPIDNLGFTIPAFAILTPIAQVSEGDLIVSAKGAVGFVTLAVDGKFEVVTTEGFATDYKPQTIKLFGQGASLQVVKSLFNFGDNKDSAMNPLMLMALMGDGKDMKSMLPFLLMGGSGLSGGSMNPLMLMALMGDKSPFR